PDFSNTPFFESRIKTIPRESQSGDLAGLMIQNLSDAQNLLDKLKNQSYRVSYFDKYNRSEFSLRLALQFLSEFAKNADIQITSFDINIGKQYFNLSTSPTYLIHLYEDWEDYKNAF